MTGDGWVPPGWLDGGAGEGHHDVPLVAHEHAPSDTHEAWIKCCTRWHAGGRKDASALGPWKELADPKERKFIVLWGDQPDYGWPEATVALEMRHQEFTCWTGVQFFTRYGGPTGSPRQKRVTDQVMARLHDTGFRLPREHYRRLDARNTMRNPDLVCHHEERNEWRFIECKGPKDRIDPRQLNALAFLHDLFGASVEVRKIVRPGGLVHRTVAGTGRYHLAP
jgi:hypothetical protein